MTRVLLVTGSRSLADDPAAERWARGLIREALDGVGLLIVGDATGPDAWAWEIATTLPAVERLYLSRWCCDGSQRIVDRHPERATRERIEWWAEGDVHTLDRNAAMVRHAKDYTARQWDVRVLALLDGRKDAAPGRVTRGTEHTAGLAERAGLAVTRETWRGEGT
jgi:hypothetical protein